jgi:MFS superfamily sulfate permease-like transporter
MNYYTMLQNLLFPKANAATLTTAANTVAYLWIRKAYLSVALMCISAFANAESIDGAMRGNQKFGVVIAVLALILTGLFTVLFFLERRLKKLESKNK